MYAAGKAPLRAVVGANSAGSESRASMLQDASNCSASAKVLQYWQEAGQNASLSSIINVAS